ncbi:MAG: GntR family transcriptional regulator [Acidobacteriia bacterium]|nr:GntR family transcriptional regulator [Terriglobia bacterium]
MCTSIDSTHMLPFRVEFKPGVSPYRQIIYAVEKSLVCGQLRPGDPFPSVRSLSQAFKINPNTAHKVVAELIRRELLEVRSGIGTIVADTPPPLPRERSALLKDDLERLVVEAKRMSLELEDLVEAVEQHWMRLSERKSSERVEAVKPRR